MFSILKVFKQTELKNSALDKQSLDKQSLEKQSLDKQSLEKQSLENQEVILKKTETCDTLKQSKFPECEHCGKHHSQKYGCFKTNPGALRKYKNRRTRSNQTRTCKPYYQIRKQILEDYEEKYHQYIPETMRGNMMEQNFGKYKLTANALRNNDKCNRLYIEYLVKKNHEKNGITENITIQHIRDTKKVLTLQYLRLQFMQRKLTLILRKNVYPLIPDCDQYFNYDLFMTNWKQKEYTVTYTMGEPYMSIIFRDMMCFDFDKKDGHTIESVKYAVELLHKTAKKNNILTVFGLMETPGGFHVYELSQTWKHDSMVTLDLMSAVGCDMLYVLMTFYRGWALRLLPKESSLNDYVARPGIDGHKVRFESKTLSSCHLLKGSPFHYKVMKFPTKEDKGNLIIGDIQNINMKLFGLANLRIALIQYCKLFPKVGMSYHGPELEECIEAHLRTVRNQFGDRINPPKYNMMISGMRSDIIRIENTVVREL